MANEKVEFSEQNLQNEKCKSGNIEINSEITPGLHFKNIDEVAEGLLHFDEEEITPNDVIKNVMDEGDFYLKCKKWDKAIAVYTTGLNSNCSDELKAKLYAKIALSHRNSGDISSALNAYQEALNLKVDYIDAAIQMAQCSLYRCKNFEDCITACNKILQHDNQNRRARSLKKEARFMRFLENDPVCKKNREEWDNIKKEKQLLQALNNKVIKVVGPTSELEIVSNLSQLEPSFSNLPLRRVRLKDRNFIWPVIFLYSGYNTYDSYDCIEDFEDNTTLQFHIEKILSQKHEWAISNGYEPHNINVYFKDYNHEYTQIPSSVTLQEILRHERFVIRDGVPVFYLFNRDSSKEKIFLNSASKQLEGEKKSHEC